MAAPAIGAPTGPGDAQPGAAPRSFTVAASGDLLIHTPVASRALALGGGGGYDFAPLFDPVRRHLARADLALCHLETPLVPGPVQGYPSFRTPPALAGSIKRVGWDACSTASNHSLDAGSTGIGTTLQALDRAKVRHTGMARSARERGRTLILDVKGVRVGFLSYTAVSNGQAIPSPWAVNMAEPGRIIADARTARRRGAEVVIVNLHWGVEYSHSISPEQAALARRLTRSPAVDAIVGQHAHVVQPIRFVRGKPVVFGEGNLISNQTVACCPAAAQDGLIALIRFEVSEDPSVRPGQSPVPPAVRARATRIRYVPTWVSHPDYRVLPAQPGTVSWQRTVAVVGRRPRIAPLRPPG